MNKITLAINYYDSPEMLRHQLLYWREYPKEVADKVCIIIVDDAAKYPASLVLANSDLPDVEIKLYRVKEDIGLNDIGARNLALTEAADGWVFMTEIDHVVPAESMENLLTAELNPSCYYSPTRYRMINFKEHEDMGFHRDSFILTRELFWKIGGYDEDLQGYYYRGPATHFRRALTRIATRVQLNSVWHLFFGLEIIPDAQVVTEEMKKRFEGPMKRNYKPKNHLRFDWERVI